MSATPNAPEPSSQPKEAQPGKNSPSDPNLDAAVKCVADGDVGGVFEFISAFVPGPYSMRRLGAMLRQVIYNARLKGPQSFLNTAFEQSHAFGLLALVRLQLAANYAFSAADADGSTERGQLPEVILSTLLPQIEKLQKLLCEQGQLWASTQAISQRTDAAKRARRAKKKRRSDIDPELERLVREILRNNPEIRASYYLDEEPDTH
jgi:hypothetical protein